ncbi:S41 family peptidase [Amycolatopsis sp. DSM 110486]|uniref:S41 family peptidase n=1 Tax=Amycolatopsis sp. DSM 110486 TaxID=2865832 RepID=UPI001C6A7555|nr:S41 family peptidase [Amycolatopsis sp. DSM 110486]QYN17119.1 S41 family peptidase [Amycolatopsis sp. DSM 110486]
MRRMLAGFVVLVLVLGLATAATVPRPDPVRDYLLTALALLRAHSIDRDSVDWPAAEADALRRTTGVTAPAGTYSAIRNVIAELGNPHTILLGPTQARPPAAHTIEVPSSSTTGDLAVLTVPRFVLDPVAEHRYIAAGEAAVRSADASRPCGWIVDLRRNDGGDMFPMLTVLAPLLDEGKLFSFEWPGGSQSVTLRAGEVLAGGTPVAAEANPMRLARQRPPVAVLTSAQTASSGEATLIAFRGLARARTFGQPTAGFATGNEVFHLSDGAELLITTARDVDRTGRVYGNTPIQPDHPLPATATTDEVIAAASAWLHTQPGCTR